MKKITRSIISIFLVLAMVMSLGIGAFAEKDKLVYTCIGDSNAAGYNTTGFIENRIAAPKAYHSLIANALDAELRPFATGGYRTDEVLYMIDPTFQMDWAYADINHGKSHKNELDEYKAEYIKAIEDADFITIQVGANDILGEDLGFAMVAAFYTPIKSFESVKSALADKGNIAAGISKIVDSVYTVAKVGVFLKEMTERLNKSYKEFGVNWDKIIENIYRLNPDVKIIAIGNINALNNTSIFEGSKIKSGKLAKPLFEKLNKYMESGSKYADTYDYCYASDIEAGELAFLSDTFEEEYLAKIHPTEAGHAEIARRVVEIVKGWK